MLTDHPRSTDCRYKLPPSRLLPPMLQTIAGRLRPFDYAERCRERYGNRFTVHMVDMAPLVFLSSPEDIRTIVSAPPDSLHAGGGGALLEPLFGKSAFMLHEQDKHSGVRNAIMPAFHRKTAQGHADMINTVVDGEVGSWPADMECSLSPYVYRLTLKTMLMTSIASRGPGDGKPAHGEPTCREPVCGESMRGEPACKGSSYRGPMHGEPMYELLCRRMLDMLSVMASPLLQEPRLRHLPGWRRTWRKFLYRRHEVDEIVYAIIAGRRDEGAADKCLRGHDRRDSRGHDRQDPRGHDRQDPRGHDRQDDLLDLLIAAHGPDGSPMSDRQVRDNLMSTIIAGHETTAATIAWAFQLLAHNRAVQDRLIEEIDSGCGDTYMNAVIQETLRHKPTFLFLPPRVVMAPTEVGGWNYDPPAQLLACTYLLHHDPELHPDPHTFRPERFLDETPPPGAVLPWGGGRKRCPGRHLALMEIRAVLRRVLSTRLVLPTSARIAPAHWRTALLTPHAGSKVILRTRRPRPHSRFAGAHSGSI
jgi:cytochrome P450